MGLDDRVCCIVHACNVVVAPSDEAVQLGMELLQSYREIAEAWPILRRQRPALAHQCEPAGDEQEGMCGVRVCACMCVCARPVLHTLHPGRLTVV